VHEPLPGPILHPPRGDLPVLLSIPHAGRHYPAWLVDLSRGGRKTLHPLEDPLVDRLAWRAINGGIAAVVAQSPRAAIDCNRAEDEIDPALVPDCKPRWTAPRPSARTRSGLGIVPSRTALHGHLWRRTLSADELEQRLTQAYRPYHAAVTAQLAALVERFGTAILLDCHSMPTLPSGSEIVLGDRYGRSAAPWLTGMAAQVAADAGFDVTINDPFAGGHIVEHHGAPHLGVHALQVEIARSCYLDRRGEPSADFDRIARFLEQLAIALGRSLAARDVPAAAE
jgi:N-formylglutamate amidohydrolase